MLVYLAGPINGCTDAECKDWRTEAKRQLPATLDPMRRDYRGLETASASAGAIVNGDKHDLRRCAAVLANCPAPSVGTSMEILYAWQHGIPVAAVVPDVATASPWLLYHVSYATDSLAHAINYIRELA